MSVASEWSMFLAAHHLRAPARLRAPSSERAMIFTRAPEVRRWIDHELFGEHVASEYVTSPADIVTGLTLVPPPWPQYLIVDVADIAASDVHWLAVIRSAGWQGMAIAIGEPPPRLHELLGIDVVLPRPVQIGSELLRTAIRRGYTSS